MRKKSEKFVRQGFADEAPKFLFHYKILLENSIHAMVVTDTVK